MIKTERKIAIVGCGLVGRSWSMLFASAGYTVSIYDNNEEQVESALRETLGQLKDFEEQGLLRGKQSAEQQHQLISASETLAHCLNGASHVQECVLENLETKRKVFEEMDALASPDVVLSSSSSAIPASQFTEALKHRSQCIISHPVNPPYLMPLVELVPAPWTDPEVVSRTRSLMQEIGQKPITLKKEITGFVQPRLQYAILSAALQLVVDNALSAEDVDKIMTEGLGLRYAFLGPLEAAHLNAQGMTEYCQKYRETIRSTESDLRTIATTDDNPEMKDVFKQLCQKVSVEQIADRRKWRDGGIAALSKLRNTLDKKDTI